MNTTPISFRLLLLGTVLFSTTCPSFAQGFRSKKSELPDAAHFYMARQEWQYVDDSPVKLHSGDGGGQQDPNQPPGAHSAAPPPRVLPRSGFQSYTPDTPVLNTKLPKTNNGVPPKAVPEKAGKGANAGRLGAVPGGAGGPGASGKPKPYSSNNNSMNGAPKAEAYPPYKGFNAASYGSSDSASSKSNVRGNVLHWAHSH